MMVTKNKRSQKKRVSVSLRKKINSQSRRYRLWLLYKHCYESKNEVAAQDQTCYNYQDFVKALQDKEYLKFVLINEENKSIGLILATENLKKAEVAYINRACYEERLETRPQNEGILYTTFLGIDPECQSLANLNKLIGAMVRYCFSNNLHAGLDYSETVSNLPKFIQRIADKLYREGEVERSATYKELDVQRFGIFEINSEE